MAIDYRDAWQRLTTAEFQYRAAQAQELERAIKVMTNALRNGEWAEHVSQDSDIAALEAEITKLVGRANASGVTPTVNRCGYCGQDMIPGSECRTSASAGQCDMYEQFAATRKVAPGVTVRPCTCYPDETRPEVCQRKYALGDCRRAAGLPDLFPPGGTAGERLQQKCSDWGTYWRAPDAHGVVLTQEQALELLRDALGVEVEFKDTAGVKGLE